MPSRVKAPQERGLSPTVGRRRRPKPDNPALLFRLQGLPDLAADAGEVIPCGPRLGYQAGIRLLIDVVGGGPDHLRVLLVEGRYPTSCLGRAALWGRDLSLPHCRHWLRTTVGAFTGLPPLPFPSHNSSVRAILVACGRSSVLREGQTRREAGRKAHWAPDKGGCRASEQRWSNRRCTRPA